MDSRQDHCPSALSLPCCQSRGGSRQIFSSMELGWQLQGCPWRLLMLHCKKVSQVGGRTLNFGNSKHHGNQYPGLEILLEFSQALKVKLPRELFHSHPSISTYAHSSCLKGSSSWGQKQELRSVWGFGCRVSSPPAPLLMLLISFT